MKKGISTPINFIIIVTIGIITLASVLLFTSIQAKASGSSTSSFQATSFCGQKCLQDNTALPTGTNLTDTTKYQKGYSCDDGETLAKNFCGSTYTIAGQKENCYDLTSCKIADGFGKSQTVDCTVTACI